MGDKYRAFVAVEIGRMPELLKFVKALRELDSDLKFVKLDKLHITLKFLGDIDEDLIPEIEDFMKKSVSGKEPFEMTLKGTGAFPNLNRISVVWAGIEGAEPLIDIAEKLDTGLTFMGFRKERREFSPHVTVARVGNTLDTIGLPDTIARFEKTEFGSINVDKIILKKSELTPDGPIYSDLVVVEL